MNMPSFVPTPPPSVRCEFRLICGASRDADRFLGRAEVAIAPARGELVNLDGTPYVVHERGFALSTAKTWEHAPRELYCFLRVCALQAQPAAKEPAP